MAVKIPIMVPRVMTPCMVVKHATHTFTSTLKMEAVGSSEMLVHTYETTWPCTQQKHNLDTDFWRNSKSHIDTKLIQYTSITMYPKYHTETL
jgi:hypothetical protein